MKPPIKTLLGARPGDIFWLMIISGMRPVAAGIMIGTIFIFVSGRSLSGLLFGISATDPGILTGAMCLLSAVALAANYLPARRAMRVAPRIALSCE
jgi:putative ABC transport system permease protein